MPGDSSAKATVSLASDRSRRGAWDGDEPPTSDVSFGSAEVTSTVDVDRWAGGTGWDEFSDVIDAPDGGYLLVGKASQLVDGTSEGFAWAVKLDAQLNPQWDRTYASQRHQETRDRGEVHDAFEFALPDPNGGFLLVGWVHDLGPDSMYVWLVNVDEWGNTRWERTRTDLFEHRSYDINSFRDTFADGVTTQDGYLLVGRTLAGEFLDERHGDGLAMFIDDRGAVQWDRTYNTVGEPHTDFFDDPRHDEFKAVVPSTSGGFVLVGEASPDGPSDETSSAGWVVAVDSTGERRWSETFRWRADVDSEIQDVLRTPDGGYLLAGAAGEDEYVSQASRYVTRGEGWVLKIDELGNESWRAGPIGERVSSVIPTSDGYLAVGEADRTGRVVTISETGERTTPEWTASVPESTFTAVTVSGDGYVVAGRGRNDGTDSIDGFVTILMGSPDSTATEITLPPDGYGAPTPGTTRSPTVIRGSHEYELTDAAKTEVEVGSEPYYVLRSIPNAAANRRAVTTPDYELVDLDSTRDALFTAMWERYMEPGVDYEAALEQAENKAGTFRTLELINRAVDIGVDALQAYVMAKTFGKDAAIDPIVDLLFESMNWAVTEINDPYEEGFAKIARTTMECRDVMALADEVDSRANLLEPLESTVEFAMALDDLTDVADAAGSVGREWSGLISEHGFRRSLTMDLSDTTSSQVTSMFAGFVVDTAVEELLDGALEANGKIMAAAHAYAVAKIPVTRRIIELEERRADARLSPAGIVTLQRLKMAFFQLGALLFSLTSKYYGAMSDLAGGPLYDVIVNAGMNAREHRQLSRTLADTGRLQMKTLGWGANQVEEQVASSINEEVIRGGAG